MYSSSVSTLVLCAFFVPAIAQTFWGQATCGSNTDYKMVPELSSGDYYNSSGTRSISWNNTALNSTGHWDISLIVNDTIRGVELKSVDNAARLVTNKGYLSVPDSVRNTSVCVYQLAPVNATSNGTDSTGCGGVLSSGCIDYLRNAVQTTNSSTSCADSPLGGYPRDSFTAACGSTVSGVANSAFIQDAGNNTCTYSSLPIEIPGNYHTFQDWRHVSPFANTTDTASWLGNQKLVPQIYDLHVTQSVPFIIAARFDGGTQDKPQSETQIVCIAPNNVTEGSRTPENREPWTVAKTSSASQQKGLSVLAFGMVVFAGLMLIP